MRGLLRLEGRDDLGALVDRHRAAVAEGAAARQAAEIGDLAGNRLEALSATADIVSWRIPSFSTSAAAASRMASATSRRCVSIVSVQSFGTLEVYTPPLYDTLCIDRDTVYR